MTTTANIVGWAGVLLGFLARYLLAYHPKRAVIVMMVSTAMLLVWACVISDWQSILLRLAAIGFQIRTLRAWARKESEIPHGKQQPC